MKRTVVAALILPPLFTLLAQEAKKVQEPEYLGVVFHLDPAGTLTPLERQAPNQEAKARVMGFGGAQVSKTYKGARSPVRFNGGEEVQFVVRLHASNGIEPNRMVNLDALKVSKNERSIILAKGGGFAGAIKTQRGEAMRPLNFAKYGEESLRMSPAQPLEPGEYLITTSVGSFLFGIDPQ